MMDLPRIARPPWFLILLLCTGAGGGIVLLLSAIGVWQAPRLVSGLAVGSLVLAVLALGASAIRSRSRARKLQEALGAQAEEEKRTASADRQAEIDDLRRSFDAAVDTLQTSRLGRTGGRGSALTALPWFLMIGPPGAGKTVAIQQSGLHFPVGAGAVRGVGGTRNCDWFFADEAIILDTAGRYMVDHDDTEEWEAFLKALKTHRPDPPINGVMVGIDILQLVDAPERDREWHATRIRRRIDELVEHLGTRFPVYLVLTKCDLLYGFVESFASLPPDAKNEPWGCTLSHDDISRIERREAAVEDIVATGFDRLVERLYDHRDRVLARASSPQTQTSRYVFPVEVAALRAGLVSFAGLLFRPNPYQEQPIFRGFYLTSGTQEGTPLAPATEQLAADHWPAERPDGRSPVRFDPDRETSSYFLRGLFTDVVVPDQEMVRATGREQRRLWRRGAVAAAGAVLCAVLVGSIAARETQEGAALLSDVEAAATAVLGQAASGSAPNLPALDELRKSVRDLERRRDEPWWRHWGLDRTNRAINPARRIYIDGVRDFVQATSFPALRRGLVRVGGGPGKVGQRAEEAENSAAHEISDAEARDDAIRDLRAFLLLTSDTGRLRADRERAFLVRHLRSRTRAAAIRESAGPPDESVEVHLDALVDGLIQKQIRGFATDSVIVRRVRDRLHEPPSLDRLYAGIRRDGEERLDRRGLADVVGEAAASLFQTPVPSISGLFTKNGYQLVAAPALERDPAKPGREGWVLGHGPEDLPAVLHAPDRVRAALEERYFSEYATAWERVLRSVAVRPFRSVRDAARTLQTLGDPLQSPLVALLGAAAVETRFADGAGAGEKDSARVQAARRVAAGGARPSVRSALGQAGEAQERAVGPHRLPPVDRRLAWLHELRADAVVRGASASPALSDVLAAFRRVGAALEARADAPGDLTAYAAQVLDPTTMTDIEETQILVQKSFGGMDSSVRRSLFEAPLRAAWGQVVAAVQAHLNRRWEGEVCRAYRTGLEDRYPMHPKSRTDASLPAFDRFFHPTDGVLASFRGEVLASFIDPDTHVPRRWGGVGLRLTAEAQEALRRADGIGRTLFSGGGLGLSFALQPDHPERADGAPAASQTYVKVHGQEAGYDMGSYRPWTSFEWPDRPGAIVRVRTRDGEGEPIQVEGDWAWWRLLERATVQRRTPTTYRVRWPLENGLVLRYMLRLPESAAFHPDPGKDLFRFHCPSILG